jgi:hypothetical protein
MPHRSVSDGSSSAGVDLRRIGFALVVALLAEFLLGLGASLWVTIRPSSPWSHISDPALFGLHALLGAAIAVMSIVALSRSGDAPGAARLWASVGLAGVLVALLCGLEFVSSGGRSGWSFAMGLGWAVALLANVCLARGD